MALDAFLASTSLITIAEIGDKTQLLSLMLVARYRKPWPILAAILLATVLNHAMAATIGREIGASIPQAFFDWVINISFIAIGIWTLVPDKLDSDEKPKHDRGVFVTTAICFFLAEMGDKTQIATIALGAQYADTLQVVAGTTLGMMLANFPAVMLGEALLKRVSLDKVRYVAAVMYVGFGIWGIGQLLHA